MHYYLCYFPLAVTFSVSPELKVLGTTRWLLWWLTACGLKAARSASRWGLTISGFHLNSLIHLLTSPFLSYFPIRHLKAYSSTWQHRSTQREHAHARTWGHSDSNTFTNKVTHASREKYTQRQKYSNRKRNLTWHIPRVGKTQLTPLELMCVRLYVGECLK